MPTSRRNMIVGLGALTVGGGAVFGSGAFSSTEAERGLEVEVIRGDSISEDALDVQVDSDSHDVDFLIDESEQTPGDLFPSNSPKVSIIENDVTISFGTFLGEATTEFNEFFEIINDPNSGNLQLTFETDGNVFQITEGDGTDYTNVTVLENDSGTEGEADDTADLSVDTGETADGGEEVSEILTVTIENTQ